MLNNITEKEFIGTLVVIKNYEFPYEIDERIEYINKYNNRIKLYRFSSNSVTGITEEVKNLNEISRENFFLWYDDCLLEDLLIEKGFSEEELNNEKLDEIFNDLLNKFN